MPALSPGLKSVLLVAATLLSVALSVLAYRVLFVETEDEPEWTITTYSGQVLVSLRGEEWVEPTMKQRLRGSDKIRTLVSGEVTLAHDASHVVVRPNTEMTVSQLSWRSADFELAEGVVTVESRGNRIKMAAASGQLTEALEAGFGMSVGPEGRATVEVGRGEVEFSSAGGSERVLEGETSTAEAGRAPSVPAVIPKSLFVNVEFPPADTFTQKHQRMRFRGNPGSRYSFDGKPITLDREGFAEIDVELPEGMSTLAITGTNTLGQTETVVSDPIRLDTKPPGLESIIWNGKPSGASP